MLSFRQKLYLGYLVVFLIFLALLFPFASKVVERIIHGSLFDVTAEMISLVHHAPDEEAMVRRLEEKAPYIFFRVSLFTRDGRLIYDSHGRGQVQDIKLYLEEHPEIDEAVDTGEGVGEGYSFFLGQRLLYVARSFDFEGELFVMRTSFPLRQIQEIIEDFEMGFLTLGVIVLILFSLMTSLIALHLSRPIQMIVRAIKPYQEGKVEQIPEIVLPKTSRRDEFGKLADTFNSLTRRVQKQIATLKEERNERVAVLESLVEGVIGVDGEMVITYANQVALDMLGRRRTELVGQKFMATGQTEFNDLLVQCQLEREMQVIPFQMGERKKIYLDVIATPKEIGGGAVLILQDKSVHYKSLEMRKDFIANASHELKTPLTVVRGFSEALHDNPEMSVEMRAEVTKKITKSCERMERLVSNLLRLADIDNLPRGNLQRMDLFDLVEQCKEFVRPVYPDATITVTKVGEEDLYILADPHLLELAITNLLDNGCKYSDHPAKIEVTLDTILDKEEVVITVRDHGRGIPPEDLENVFLRFYTVDKARSRQLGGSGLGLSIVYTIVQKHFGKITLDSEVGKGSTFTIVLPTDIQKYH